MPLINVMREMAGEAGWSDRDFDVRLSVYMDVGTLTSPERQELLDMSVDQRIAWLALSRFPPDAMPMVTLDFNAHGYVTRDGLAKFGGVGQAQS